MKFKSSYIWAVLIALLIIGWMFSDNILDKDNVKNEKETSIIEDIRSERKLLISALKVLNVPIEKVIRTRGVTHPEFEVSISSEIDGKVTFVNAKEGQNISKGFKILTIDTGTLNQKILAAKANLTAAKKIFEISKKVSNGTLKEELSAAKAKLDLANKNLIITEKLAKSNFATPLEVSEKKSAVENAQVQVAILKNNQNFNSEKDLANSFANLEQSKSSLASLEEELVNSVIISPVEGKLEVLNADAGERITRNNPIATILGMSEINLIVKVSQADVGQININDMASIKVADGGEYTGIVSKISSIANEATRTFNVEISIENSKFKIKAGMTAEANIITDTVYAFGLSPAHLIVNSDGALFVKIVKNNKVKTQFVKIIKSVEDKVFISGLMDGTILLTNGQAFVEEDDLVKYTLEKK